MPDYDGDIKLGVSLEPKDIKSAAKSLMDALQKIFKSVSGKDLDTKFKSLQASMSKSADKATQLQQKLSELENTKIPTEEYKEIQSWLDKQQSALSKIEEKMEHMVDIGKNSGDAWDRMQEQADQLRNSVEEGRGELQELVNAGKGFTLGSETSEYQKLLGQLNDVNNQQTINVAKAEEMIRVQQEAELEQQRAADVQQILAEKESAAISDEETNYVGFLGTLNRVRDALVSVGTAAINSIPSALANLRERINNFMRPFNNLMERLKEGSTRIKTKLSEIAKSITNIGHSAKSAQSPVSSLFKKFLMYGLGIRSIFALIRKLRSAVIEGFKELAQVNDGANDTNKSISALQASLENIKYSWAAAFSPILTLVTPALTQLMDLVSKAASYVSMFFSLLAGRSTYIRAIKQQKDYAKSLDKTAQAADNAKLATYDQLEVISKDKGGDSGAGADSLFEEVPIDASKWMEELKDVLEKFWKTIKAALDRFKKAFDNLWSAIKKSLAELWDEGVIQAWIDSVARLIASIINVASSMIEAFTRAWTKDDNGTKFLRSIFNMLTAINELLITINGSIEKAFNSEVGTHIFENLLQIFTNINDTVANLATNFRLAWEEAGTGDAIIMDIFNMLDSILTHINNITASTKEWSEALDFGPLLTSVENVLNNIKPIVDDIGETLEWLWNEILLPLSTWTIEDAVPAALDSIAAALDLMHNVIDVVQRNLTLIWDNFLEPAMGFVGDAIIAVFDSLAENLQKIADNEDAVEILGDVLTAVLLIIGAFLTFKTVAAVVGVAAGVLAGIIGFLTSPIGLVILAITAIIAIGVLLIKHWDEVKEKAKEIADKIVAKFTEWKEKLKNIMNTVKENWNNAWRAMWNFVKGIINNIIDAINNGIIRSFESAINSMINGLNRAINMLPDAVRSGLNINQISNISLPRIPRLAEGAVIPANREFLAMLGDQKSGVNIETPLDTMVEAFKQAMRESGDNKSPIVLQLNGREVARAVWDEDTKRYRQTGRPAYT